MLVAVQLFVLGLYLPPVFKIDVGLELNPTPDDHFTAGPDCRVARPSEGALVVLVAVQLSVLGLYLPPVFEISAATYLHPRRSFHCRSRLPCESIGQRVRWSCWWLSNYPCSGLYLPPVLKGLLSSPPPQTIISLPVQTAV